MGKRRSPKKPVTSPDHTAAKKKADSSHWTLEQDDALLTDLVTLKDEGKMSENSFKKQYFAAIAESLEVRYPAIKGVAKTMSSTQSRWQKVHKQLVCIPMDSLTTYYFTA
jgi:hypothetical protein